ncbi:hypothetical protein, partial [Antrihabitans spumae]
CDTTPEPPWPTDSDGYHDVDLFTRKVLLELDVIVPQQDELSQLRAPFFMYDTNSEGITVKAAG